MVRRYLSTIKLGDVVDVAGVDVACKSEDVRDPNDRRYRYVAQSAAGWRVTIEVRADTWTYMARLVRPRPDDPVTEAAISAWLRQAAAL